MSWPLLLALCAGTFAMKATGPIIVGRRELSPTGARLAALIAVPVLAAMVMLQTITTGQSFVLDARAPALLVAALLVWRRAPFLVVVLAAAFTAAAIRAVA